MLQKAVLDVPLARGLDTKTDPFLVDMGLSLELINARFQKTGKLSKRYGLNLVDTAPGTGIHLVADNENLNILSSSGIYARIEGSQSWANVSPYTHSAKIQTEFISKSPYDQIQNDCDTDPNGLFVGHVFAQYSGASAYNPVIVLEDVETGEKLVKFISTAATGPMTQQRIVLTRSAGTLYINVFFFDGTLNLQHSIYDQTLALLSTATVTTFSDQGKFDLCKSASNIYLTVIKNVTMTNYKYTLAGVLVTSVPLTIPNTITTGSGAYGMCTGFISNHLHVAYIDSFQNANLVGFNSALANDITLATSPSNSLVVGFCQSTTGLALFESDNTAPSSIQTAYSEVSFTTTYVITPQRTLGRVILLSQPYYYDSQVFVPMFTSETSGGNGNNAYLYNATQGYLSNTFSRGLILFNTKTTISKSPFIGTDFYSGLPRLFRVNTNSLSTDPEFSSNQGASRNKFSMDENTKSGTRFKIGSSIYYTNGATIEVDRRRPHENGFMMNPIITSVLASTGVATPAVASKKFSYCSIYEFYDGSGQITRSAPSAINTQYASSATPANTNNIQVTYKELVASLKYRSDEVIKGQTVIYRTLDNGTTFYRLLEIPFTSNLGATITIADIQSDANLSNNEILYTTGNVLPNDPAPTSKFSTAGGNRLFLGGLEEKDDIAYSKKQLFGESVAFSDFLTIRISSATTADKSPINGLGYMDGKLIIFRQRSIYYVQGDGPNELGLNDTFSPPETISSDVGCIDPRSVLNTPDGIMFKSQKGIYLLTRGMAVKYIGAGVEDFNDESIIASILAEKYNEARFYTDQGNCLVYNYLFQQWSQFEDQTSTDADNWESEITSLITNVYQEGSTFLDNSVAYPMTTKTSWIKLNGIQGYQRIWSANILGNYKSAHNLVVKVRYDYNDSYVETYTITPQPTDTQYQYRIHLKQQKCESIQFEIMDSSEVGESMELTMLTLEVGVKKGSMKLGATRKY